MSALRPESVWLVVRREVQFRERACGWATGRVSSMPGQNFYRDGQDLRDAGDIGFGIGDLMRDMVVGSRILRIFGIGGRGHDPEQPQGLPLRGAGSEPPVLRWFKMSGLSKEVRYNRADVLSALLKNNRISQAVSHLGLTGVVFAALERFPPSPQPSPIKGEGANGSYLPLPDHLERGTPIRKLRELEEWHTRDWI